MIGPPGMYCVQALREFLVFGACVLLHASPVLLKGAAAGGSTTGFYLSTNGTTGGTYIGYRYPGTLGAGASSGPVDLQRGQELVLGLVWQVRGISASI